MQEWLAAHAGEYSREFCEAYAWRTSDTREVAARYLREIDEADVAAYREGLSTEELAAFDMHVLGLWRSMGHVYDEYERRTHTASATRLSPSRRKFASWWSFRRPSRGSNVAACFTTRLASGGVPSMRPALSARGS